ncbi:hypothetical protein [Hyalangium rubrum]|uniref:Uncharacterized protein n=1 Tax=Hyalangium rubrum TaxID=3103134 RepID=A0ABU5H934_9BACT|nr:hypothetical protein [Hyalangium sp. s54d21]MDY7229364.1 hypothetical protein [Hyalangium sp. s54d21]
MEKHDINEAEPALRARLEGLGAKHWTELAGVRLAWVRSGVWLALGERFVPAPRSVEELSEALRGSQAELDSETSLEEVMELVELTTDARVVRTEEDLSYLTLDQPGPEVISSGTIGERGLARWEAPHRDPQGLVFYANLRREGGADFVRMQVDRATRSISVEVVDGGWFEIAAILG